MASPIITYISNDCYLYKASPTTNYNNTDLVIGYWGGADGRAPILRVTLPSIPEPGAVIDTLDLNMYYKATSSNQVLPVNIHVGLGGTPDISWVDSEATWYVYSTGNNWTAAGAGSDFNSTIIDTANMPAVAGSWINWQLKGAGATNPISPNWGDTLNIKLSAPTASGNKTFASSDTAGTTSDPYIEIEYTIASTFLTKIIIHWLIIKNQSMI